MPEAGVLGRTLRLRTGEVDLGRQRLVGPSAVVALTTRETELLTYLAARAGQAVAREALLVDVWHYRASNPTRAVDLAVKRLRSKIEPDPSEPVHILSVHGVGYRFVPVDDAPPTAAAPAPVSGVVAPPAALSTDRTTFVGRTEERFRLRELFHSGARLVSLTGTAGTGKTRLSRRFAADYLRDFAGGTAYVDLVEARGVEGICDGVVGALELPVGTDTDPATLGRALSDRTDGRMLIVLDNFEHLVEHAAATVGLWLDAAPRAVFLVTSRERLHVRGERVFELAPLPTKDALDLLLDRAQGLRRSSVAGTDGPAPTLELSDSDRDVLRDVVVQLDGIPLAIELAASRLGSLSPSQLLKRLSSRFRLLGDPRGDRPRRHASLEAALDWSWELATVAERSALMALSVFEGGFSLEAAEEVLDEPNQPDAPWPADIVQSLRDKSLLAMEETLDGDLRYRLLESIREYAHARLVGAEPELEASFRARHADYYLREAEDGASRLFRAGGVQRMEALVREKANLIAVARGAPSPEQRIRAVGCLFPVLQARGPLPLLEELLDKAVELGASPGVDRRHYGRILVDRGFHHYSRDRLKPAVADFEEAVRVAPQHLDGLARAAMGLGRVRADQGRLEDAANDLREAIELYTRLGDRAGEGRARNLFAEVLVQQDCVDEAAAEFDRALRILRRVGDRWTEGLLYSNLAAFLLEKRHRPEDAERHANEALQILGEVGDHRASVVLLLGFAIALVRMARPNEAFHKLDLAVTTARRMGDRTREGQAHSIRGWALSELGRNEEAERHLQDALVLLRETGDTLQEAVTLRRLAAVYQECGRFEEAEHALLEALDELQPRSARIERAVTLLQLGMLRLEQGDHDRCRAVLSEASAEASSVVPWAQRQAAGLLAVSYAASGEHEAAQRCVDQLRGGVVDPREADLLSPVLALVQLSRPDVERGRARVRAEQAMVEERPAYFERRLVVRLLAAALAS